MTRSDVAFNRVEAEARMARAKALYTLAATAALAGDPKAPALAEAALEKISEARAALKAISDA